MQAARQARGKVSHLIVQDLGRVEGGLGQAGALVLEDGESGRGSLGVLLHPARVTGGREAAGGGGCGTAASTATAGTGMG